MRLYNNFVLLFPAVSFHRIVEIHEEKHRFPYQKTDGWSFSLMYEDESKSPRGKVEGEGWG